MTTGPDSYPLALAVGVTSSRIANVSPPARALHRAILRAFATTGRAPDAAALAKATPAGHDLDGLAATPPSPPSTRPAARRST